MKKIKIFGALLLLVTYMSGCIKNDEIEFRDTFAEIDAASWNANSAGVTYPILTRRLPDNRPVSTTVDSTARRLNGTIRIRINLVGPHSSKDETVGYKTFTSPITSVAFPATIGGQLPAQPAATLAVSDAIPGTHYAVAGGAITIPAGSSFGYITINVINAGATAGQARFIGIELDETGSVKPSPNYNKVGIVIDQR